MARNKFPEETERKILEVSFRLFQEKGYDHTTIQDIVNGLGMSKGAVYHHFKSKEEILDRLYDRAYRLRSLPGFGCRLPHRAGKNTGAVPPPVYRPGQAGCGQSADLL